MSLSQLQEQTRTIKHEIQLMKRKLNKLDNLIDTYSEQLELTIFELEHEGYIRKTDLNDDELLTGHKLYDHVRRQVKNGLYTDRTLALFKRARLERRREYRTIWESKEVENIIRDLEGRLSSTLYMIEDLDDQ